jgi:hypothetical protein
VIEPLAEIIDSRGPPNDYVMRGDTLFIVSGGKAELLAYDLSNPTAPKKLFAGVYDDYNFQSILVSPEGIAYVVGPMGLTVFDVRKPARTSLLGHHWRFGKSRIVMQRHGPLAMVRDHLFVCSEGVGLIAIDVNNPVKPKLLGIAKFVRGLSRGVVRYRGSTLLANDAQGIGPIDVKDPTRMAFVALDDPRYLPLQELVDIQPSSDPTILFAVGPGPILYTVDLSQPKVAATLDLSELTGGKAVWDLSLSPDDALLLCGTTRGLCAVNVVNPRNPIPMRKFEAGLYTSRFYGDLLLSRGTAHKLVVHRVSGTDTIGTLGSSRTEQDSEARQHRSKRPRALAQPKGGQHDVSGYEVEWKAVRRSGRGSYTTYTIACRSITADVWTLVDVEVASARPRYVLTGLSPNRRHMARIRTRLEDGEHSPWSPIHRFQTPSPAPSWEAEDAISVTATNAMLRWSVPDDAEGAFQAFTIFVRRKNVRESFRLHETRDPWARSFLLEGLTPGTAYEAQIRGTYEPLNTSDRTRLRVFKTAAE